MRFFMLSTVLGLCALVLDVGQLATAAAEGAPATIRVTLPSDATLTVDSNPTKATSADRLFITPALEPGQSFKYSLKAEFVRDGKTITVRQDIVVRAGRETRVDLNLPGGARLDSAYSYGPGPDTRAYYYSPEQAAANPVVGYSTYYNSYPTENYRSPSSSSSGFAPIHYGTDQSDPFYHSGQ